MVAPISGSTSVQTLQTAISPTNNAAEIIPQGVDRLNAVNVGSAVNTEAILGRINGERGNLVSAIA